MELIYFINGCIVVRNLEIKDDKCCDIYLTIWSEVIISYGLFIELTIQFHENVLMVWRRNFAFKMKKRSVQTQTVIELFPFYLNTLFNLVR